MSHIEALVEQQLMYLCKFRLLELTTWTTAEFTEIGSLLSASVDDIHTPERIDTFDSQKLTSSYIEVEAYIMSHDIFYIFQILQENIENVVEVFSYVKSMFCTDTMNHRSVDRNNKTFRLNDMILCLDEFSFRIMNLPSNLHHARPVVEVSQWSIFI